MTIHCTSTDTQTMHPPSITRQLPTAINKRIALLSSDEQTFKESTPIYQNALIVTLIMNLRTFRMHRNGHVGIGNAT